MSIVSFQYVLCVKLTDHSVVLTPEIYVIRAHNWLLFSEINVNFCTILQLTELNVQRFYSSFLFVDVASDVTSTLLQQAIIIYQLRCCNGPFVCLSVPFSNLNRERGAY